MRRVVAAGAGAVVAALAVSYAPVHARTVPASAGHRWCAERADARVESPTAALALIVGVGVDTEADAPNAFACWSNSANAEVVRAWARPERGVAGLECAPMRGSRTELRCHRVIAHSPVDDDGHKAVERSVEGAQGAADATSDAVDVAGTTPGLCVDATCTSGWHVGAQVDHGAGVATGEDECRLQPGKRCVVGGRDDDGDDVPVEAAPGAHPSVEPDDDGEQKEVRVPENA